MANELGLAETVRVSYAITKELAGRIEATAALAAVALAATPDRLTIEYAVTALEAIRATAFELVNDVGVQAETVGVTDSEAETERTATMRAEMAANHLAETKQH